MRQTIKDNLQLLKYVWKYSPAIIIWRIINVCLNIAVDATLNVMFLQVVVDAMTAGMGMGVVLKYVLVVTIIMLTHDFANAIYSQYIEPVGKQRIHQGMHNRIFDRIRKIDLEKFDDADFYNDYIWALKEVDNRTMKAFAMVSEFFKAVISSLVFVIISIRFDWRFLGFVLVPVGIRMAVSTYKSRINYELNVELNEVNRKKDYVRRTFYLKDYAKEMRVYPIASVLLKMFNSCVNKSIAIIKKYRNRFVAATNLETSTYWLFGKLPITIYMCYLVLVSHSLTIGAFVAMYSAASKLMYSLASIFVIVPTVRENGLFSKKVLRILNCRGKIEEETEGEDMKGEFTGLQLEHVSFAYPFGKGKILQDINIKVGKGEKIAIVGLNGAGKTTLIKLIMRFYDPTEGRILVNGRNIVDFKVKDYREQIAAVFQDFQLYAVSVAENVSMSEDGQGQDGSVRNMLHKVGLPEFENQLNQTMTKEFDKSGIVCSGGQKQKISIARALNRNSEILILDEASSALDPIAEDKMQRLIMEQGKTTIFISHRLSFVQNVDRIYFMENGSVMEAGSHEELMKKNGKYAQMYNIQAEKFRLNNQCEKAKEM